MENNRIDLAHFQQVPLIIEVPTSAFCGVAILAIAMPQKDRTKTNFKWRKLEIQRITANAIIDLRENITGINLDAKATLSLRRITKCFAASVEIN